jgi:hypothetical protein
MHVVRISLSLVMPELNFLHTLLNTLHIVQKVHTEVVGILRLTIHQHISFYDKQGQYSKPLHTV